VSAAPPAQPVPGVPPWPEPELGQWVTVPPRGGEEPPLECWLSLPPQGPARAGVLVLPEIFGINPWVRSVAGRLALAGYAALVVPLFSRTAPGLALGYDADAVRVGRAHKERTTAPQLLADLSRAAAWLVEVQPGLPAGLGCVGFCFGGHGAAGRWRPQPRWGGRQPRTAALSLRQRRSAHPCRGGGGDRHRSDGCQRPPATLR